MRIPYTLIPSATPLGKSTVSKTPMIKLGFNGFYINCLIDTGAVVSMMPSEFGIEFGLNIKKGELF